MKKILEYFRKTFTNSILLWKFFTVEEFFDKGGYIYTLIPGSNVDYYKYVSYDVFINDYPDFVWRVGDKTKYVLGEYDAQPENTPELGFVCRVPSLVPNYGNISLSIIAIGFIIGLITMFCVSMAAGFLYVAFSAMVIGGILHYLSNRTVISIDRK